MESGDILGHENMGEIIELGSEVTNLSVGDRVVVPFTVLVLQEGHALCLRPHQSERRDGDQGDGPIAGRLFGFSPMLDGYSGGHAEWNGVSDPVKKAIKLPLCI